MLVVWLFKCVLQSGLLIGKTGSVAECLDFPHKVRTVVRLELVGYISAVENIQFPHLINVATTFRHYLDPTRFRPLNACLIALHCAHTDKIKI